MWTPKYVELRDPSNKLLQKTVQYTEDGPIEILYPIPGHKKESIPRLTKEAIAKTQPAWVDLTDDEVNKLLENTDWYEWPHLLAKNVQDALKRKNNVL
jgi:hypothetical protein